MVTILSKCEKQRPNMLLWLTLQRRPYSLQYAGRNSQCDSSKYNFKTWKNYNWAIFLYRNKQVGGRIKHIDACFHFIRKKMENGSIVVSYVNMVKILLIYCRKFSLRLSTIGTHVRKEMALEIDKTGILQCDQFKYWVGRVERYSTIHAEILDTTVSSKCARKFVNKGA